MALLLTSRGLRQRALQEGHAATPPALAAGAALGTTALIHQMKPGGARTLVGLGCMGGGAYLAVKAGDKLIRSVSVGVAAGGLWSLLMKG
jgi:hypothetical protein